MRRTGILLAGIVIVAALAGCNSNPPANSTDTTTAVGGSKPQGKKIVMGFSQVGAESGWRTANTQSMQDAAKEAGIELKFSDAQQKQENQIKAIRSFIAEGVDVICFAPVVTTGWQPVLEEAKRAHIPVVVEDRRPDVSDTLYETFIGDDFIHEGEMAAQWLAKKTNGKANVVEILGTAGSAPAIDREKGFAEGIKASPGIHVVQTVGSDFTRNGGKQAMEAILKGEHGKDLTAVFCHNDDMAIGAIQAMKEAGRKPGTDIIVFSIDGIKPIFEEMAKGESNCTVECNPLLGPLVMEAAKDVVAGKKLPKRQVVQDHVYDQSQAAAELPNRKY